MKDAQGCVFYHRMDIPGHGLVGDHWDLRGAEQAYVGGVALAGRRVLEIGPASGHLTYWMESQGAEVVAVDLSPDDEWDFVPQHSLDLEAIRQERVAVMRGLRRGFWFAHERFGSNARVHYGSVYRLPEELGRFDVAVVAAVLLHLRDPLAALGRCARLCDHIVVTDLHTPELDGSPVARLEPALDPGNWHTWWRFSPELIAGYLAVLGLEVSQTTFHEQLHVSGDREYSMPMFTVAASRPSP